MVCVDFKSHEVLVDECQEAKVFGFSGKQVVHPDQISYVNGIFGPSEQDVMWARQVLGLRVLNGCAFELNGIVIDEPSTYTIYSIIAHSDKACAKYSCSFCRWDSSAIAYDILTSIFSIKEPLIFTVPKNR